MSTELFRKYIDIINEAEEVAQANSAVPQQDVANAWTQNKQKAKMFIKNVPVALLTAGNIPEKYIPLAQQEAGKRDQTSYSPEKFNNGLLIFQAPKPGKGEIYISDKSNMANYMPYKGTITPALSEYLNSFGVDGSSTKLYVKKALTPMIPASLLGLEGKRIQTSWGDQAVDKGAFLTQEANGHTYCVNPDDQGLPIGYVPAR